MGRWQIVVREDAERASHEKLMSREPPLPGGFIRGDVWASCDLVVAGIVAVKKHTKGSLIGPSIRDPTERLVVSWSQRWHIRVF